MAQKTEGQPANIASQLDVATVVNESQPEPVATTAAVQLETVAAKPVAATGKGKGKGKPPPPKKGKGKGPLPNPSEFSERPKFPPPDKGKGKSGKAKNGSPAPPKACQPLGRRIGLAPIPVGGAEGRRNTIFESLIHERWEVVDEDIQELQRVFAKQEGARGSSTPERKFSHGKSEFQVLSIKDAQNIAIVLKSLPLKGASLSTSIEMLDAEKWDSEKVERLVAALPKADQQRALLAVAARPDQENNLCDIEQTILPLMRVGRIEQRLKALCIAARLREKEDMLMTQMQVLQKACNELRSSETLKAVLGAVLVMFNFVNYGTVNEEEPSAFDMSTLLRLNDFKTPQGPFPNFDGTHFIAMRLLAKDPKLRANSLLKELGAAGPASGVSLHTIQSAITSLREEIRFLQSEHANFPAEYGGKAPTPQPEIIVKSEPVVEEANVQGKNCANLESLLVDCEQQQAMGTAAIVAEDNAAMVAKDREQQALNDAVQTNDAEFQRHKKRYALFRWVRRWVRKILGQEGDLLNTTGIPLVVSRPPIAPHPSSVLLGDPDGVTDAPFQWSLVRMDVRRPGLICIEALHNNSRGSSSSNRRYVVVSGAEVVPMNSKLASHASRDAARAHPNGIELKNVVVQGHIHRSKGVRLWIGFEAPAIAETWFQSLSSLAKVPGTGFLLVYSRGSGIWRRRWTVLHNATETRDIQLLWYRTPGEYLRNEQPIGGMLLKQGNSLVSISDASKYPFGFEVTSHAFRESRLSSTDSIGSVPSFRILRRGQSAQSICLRALSELEMSRWLEMLTELLNGNDSAHVADDASCPLEEELPLPQLSGVTDLSTSHHGMDEPCIPKREDGPAPSSQPRGDDPSAEKLKYTAEEAMGSPREHKEHVDLSEGKGKEESKNCGPTSLEFSAPLKACVSTSHESKAAKMDFKPGQSASSSDGLTTGYDEESIGEDFSSSDSDKSTDSDTESDTDRCMGCKPKTALQQLSLIRQQAEASEAQLSLSLVATTESCRQILAYFAQPVPDASFGLLSNQVESFFLNIHTFASRLVTSFNKVEQYRQNGLRRSNYDPILAVHGGSPSKQQAALKFLTFEVPGKITPRLDSPERKTFQPGTPRTQEKKTLRLGTPQPGSTEKKTPPRLLRRRVSFDDDELPQAQHAAQTLVAGLVYRSD